MAPVLVLHGVPFPQCIRVWPPLLETLGPWCRQHLLFYGLQKMEGRKFMAAMHFLLRCCYWMILLDSPFCSHGLPHGAPGSCLPLPHLLPFLLHNLRAPLLSFGGTVKSSSFFLRAAAEDPSQTKLGNTTCLANEKRSIADESAELWEASSGKEGCPPLRETEDRAPPCLGFLPGDSCWRLASRASFPWLEDPLGPRLLQAI